jgi:hypothetical protein
MARVGCNRPVAPLARARALALALPLLSGCATPPRGQHDLLDFVVDGQTPCALVQERLGSPAACLEQGRICMYRIGEDRNGYTVGQADTDARPFGPGFWSGLRYSFVVVCGPSGTVERHSLVPVKNGQGEASHGHGQ